MEPPYRKLGYAEVDGEGGPPQKTGPTKVNLELRTRRAQIRSGSEVGKLDKVTGGEEAAEKTELLETRCGAR